MAGRNLNDGFEALATRTQGLSWLLLRVLAGAMFMTHGYDKLFGGNQQPLMGGMGFFGTDLGINMLWVAAIIEFFGGALILAGLLTRWTALLAAILMVMAYLSAHRAWFPTLNGGELAAMYFLVFFAIFAYGPGRFSLDSILFGRS